MKVRFIFLLFFFCLLVFSFVSAQTGGNLIITWHANNYVPEDFQEKAFPTNGNTVQVSVEFLLGQKIQNISQVDISWFVDGVFFTKGTGLKEMSFPITKVGRSSHSVRVVIQTKTDKYEGIISIPVFNPIITIENKYPRGLVRSGEQVSFFVIPYFFNISSPSEITSLWTINGNAQEGTRDTLLTLNIGAPKTSEQKNMTIESFVQNIKNGLEFAKEKINLYIQ